MFALIAEMPLPFQIGTLFLIFIFRSTLTAGVCSLWIHFSKWAKNRTIIPVKEGATIWKDVMFGVGILFLDAIVITAAFRWGLVKGRHQSLTLENALTFALLFVWVEIYFYYSHRLMHLPKFYWIHKHHHHLRATNPWTSLSFSVLERFVLYIGVLLVPGIISQFVPIPVNAYFVYFLMNYLLNVYGHLNVETLPPWLLQRPWGRILNTTTYHALHHARYRGHFGLFTPWLDSWHGTRFSDYEQIHAQVARK